MASPLSPSSTKRKLEITTEIASNPKVEPSEPTSIDEGPPRKKVNVPTPTPTPTPTPKPPPRQVASIHDLDILLNDKHAPNRTIGSKLWKQAKTEERERAANDKMPHYSLDQRKDMALKIFQDYIRHIDDNDNGDKTAIKFEPQFWHKLQKDEQPTPDMNLGRVGSVETLYRRIDRDNKAILNNLASFRLPRSRPRQRTTKSFVSSVPSMPSAHQYANPPQQLQVQVQSQMPHQHRVQHQVQQVHIPIMHQMPVQQQNVQTQPQQTQQMWTTASQVLPAATEKRETFLLSTQPAAAPTASMPAQTSSTATAAAPGPATMTVALPHFALQSAPASAAPTACAPKNSVMPESSGARIVTNPEPQIQQQQQQPQPQIQQQQQVQPDLSQIRLVLGGSNLSFRLVPITNETQCEAPSPVSTTAPSFQLQIVPPQMQPGQQNKNGDGKSTQVAHILAAMSKNSSPSAQSS